MKKIPCKIIEAFYTSTFFCIYPFAWAHLGSTHVPGKKTHHLSHTIKIYDLESYHTVMLNLVIDAENDFCQALKEFILSPIVHINHLDLTTSFKPLGSTSNEDIEQEICEYLLEQ